MNNAEIDLSKLIDVARKDSGINNSIDAMEQVSLLLLLKYFYTVTLSDVTWKNSILSFRNFFVKNNVFSSAKIEADYEKLRTVLHDIVSSVEHPLDPDYCDSVTLITWGRVEDIVAAIPFRIRSDKVLDGLLLHLDHIDFDNFFAEAYDKLVVSMINESMASGAFHTPRALVAAIVKVINPSSKQSVYDPALGMGRFIIETKKLIEERSNNKFCSTHYAFGQDISPFACLVGSLNLMLNGVDIRNVSLGNSLLDSDNSSYDIVLSGVPFGKVSDFDRYEYDYHDCSSSIEAMFLKLSMKKLAQGGKAALIVPEGLLSNRSHEDLRRQLLTRFNLHSILSLPNGTLSPYTGIKVSVLFFENAKIDEDIWFYELKTSKQFSKINQISDFHFAEFIELFSKRIKTDQSFLISKKEIFNRDFLNLSFKLLENADEIKSLEIVDELQRLNENKQEFDALWLNLAESLKVRQEFVFSEKTTFGKLLSLSAGKNLTKAQIKEQGEYPVYGGNGIIGYYDEYNRSGENIIIGRVGANCGNVHFVTDPIWLTDNSFSVQIKVSSKVHQPYLAHLLRSMDLNRLGRGAAQPSISYSKIKDIEISLPPYEKQVELSKWFDEMNLQRAELIDSIKRQTEKFNELTNYSIVSNCIGEKITY